jgi:hypothetical protein
MLSIFSIFSIISFSINIIILIIIIMFFVTVVPKINGIVTNVKDSLVYKDGVLCTKNSKSISNISTSIKNDFNDVRSFPFVSSIVPSSQDVDNLFNNFQVVPECK